MVPDVYKEFFASQLDGGEGFPYSVLTPRFTGFLRQENEKLITSLDNKIFILENANDQVSTDCYSIPDINYIEAGSILLKAWMRISGINTDGILSSSTLRFNTVTEYMFHPFVDQVRGNGRDQHRAEDEAGPAVFDYLSQIDFKFMNYAKNAASGEKVIASVYQPEIRSKIISIFGKSLYRTIYPTHISILTEKLLTLIKDTGAGRTNGNRRFGGIWLFIPIEKINVGSILVKDGDLLEFSLKLAGDERIDILFSKSKQPEIENLISRIRELQERLPSN